MQRTRTRPIILLVEDYADSREMLRLLLEEFEYEVLSAVDGNDALMVAANNHIDIVVADFGLPDMTGVAVAQQLRQLNGHLKQVPVVMLTAFDEDKIRRLADKAGCNAFLTKPPDFETLQRTLQQLLQENVNSRRERADEDLT